MVKLKSENTIQFKLTSVAPDFNGASIKLNFSNFNNPYSQRKIQTVSVRPFADAECLGTPSSFDINSKLNFFWVETPADNVNLSSSAKSMNGTQELGYQSSDN